MRGQFVETVSKLIQNDERVVLLLGDIGVYGFKKHSYILNYLKKVSISVVCSRWEEPFGRTSLEAASRGCAVIISNRGGLPETITNGVILRKLNSINLYK